MSFWSNPAQSLGIGGWLGTGLNQLGTDMTTAWTHPGLKNIQRVTDPAGASIRSALTGDSSWADPGSTLTSNWRQAHGDTGATPSNVSKDAMAITLASMLGGTTSGLGLGAGSGSSGSIPSWLKYGLMGVNMMNQSGPQGSGGGGLIGGGGQMGRSLMNAGAPSSAPQGMGSTINPLLGLMLYQNMQKQNQQNQQPVNLNPPPNYPSGYMGISDQIMQNLGMGGNYGQ